jgi:hypothetical protein
MAARNSTVGASTQRVPGWPQIGHADHLEGCCIRVERAYPVYVTVGSRRAVHKWGDFLLLKPHRIGLQMLWNQSAPDRAHSCIQSTLWKDNLRIRCLTVDIENTAALIRHILRGAT